jgi:hypothetical protein
MRIGTEEVSAACDLGAREKNRKEIRMTLNILEMVDIKLV